MIKKFGIENFRVFKEYTEFELAPITVLTGPNNSGKSSFLKLLNLIQHSFGKNGSTNELIFNDGTHNLGTFEKTVHWNKESEYIRIVINFPLEYFDEQFELELTYKKMKENAILNSFKIFNDKRILFNLFDLHMQYYEVSDIDYSFSIDLAYLKRTINIHTKCNELRNYSDSITANYKSYLSKFGEEEKENLEFYRFKKNIGIPNEKLPMPIEYFAQIHFSEEYEKMAAEPLQFFNYLDEDGLLNDEDFSDIENEIFESKHFSDNFGFKTKGSDFFTDIFFEDGYASDELLRFIGFNSDKISRIEISKQNEENFNKYFVQNINLALEKVKFSLGSFYHLSAVRGGKARVLSNNSNNDIDEIVRDFTKYDLIEESKMIDEDNFVKYFPNKNKEFLSQAFCLLKIKGELVIERIEGVASLIYFKNGEKKTSLADLGYGYSQIIPILLKIILINRDAELNAEKFINPYLKNAPFMTDYSSLNFWYSTLVIEEPEANLHPNLQSKLADILVLAFKTFGTRFLLETHSEYLIRKLQYLTAKNEIQTGETNIYYFNADEFVNEQEKKVKKITINEFGGLSDTFGPGFFDEATRLQFELLKINQEQSN